MPQNVVVLRGKVNAINTVGRNVIACIQEVHLHEISQISIELTELGRLLMRAAEQGLEIGMGHWRQRWGCDDQNLRRGVSCPDATC